MFFSSFNPPPVDLTLTTDDVHIWYASLDAQISLSQIFLKTLSPDERMRAERFYFEKDRKRFIVGRGILRSILGNYLDIAPSRLRFCYGDNGKPAFADTACQGTIRFNLSHSNGRALFAFAIDRAIGIDIEKVHDMPDMSHIAERFFSERENKLFRALPECQKREAFFNCWTRKEAFIKAIGDGLIMPLNSFDVTLIPGEPAKLINVPGDPENDVNWSLQELTPYPGYIGAFAVEGDSWHLACWQWEWDEY